MDADDAPGNDTTCHVTCHVSLSPTRALATDTSPQLAPYVRIITIKLFIGPSLQHALLTDAVWVFVHSAYLSGSIVRDP